MPGEEEKKVEAPKEAKAKGGDGPPYNNSHTININI